MSFCAALAGSSSQVSCGVLPALMAGCSPSVLCSLGACTSEASKIYPAMGKATLFVQLRVEGLHCPPVSVSVSVMRLRKWRMVFSWWVRSPGENLRNRIQLMRSRIMNSMRASDSLCWAWIGVLNMAAGS